MHYFDHDTSASGDDKIIALRLEHGGAAVDAYWSLLELMYSEEGPLNLAENRPLAKAVSYRLAVDYQQLSEWVDSMVSIGLFERVEDDQDCITSKRAMAHISKYRDKCEKARLNGQKGGKTSKRKSNRKANANQSLSDGEAIRTRTRGIGSHKENQIPIASDGAAVAGATPPPLPDGFERTGVICSHAGCNERAIREKLSGTLWCPSCNAGELEMMGVEL